MAAHGCPVNRAPYLCHTRSPHGPRPAEEFQTRILPIKATIINDATRLALEVVHHILVLYVEHSTRRKYFAPMRHEVTVMSVVAAQLPQVVCVRLIAYEEVREARQASINRVSAGMNNRRIWKNEVNESDEKKVARQFVYYSIGRDARKLG